MLQSLTERIGQQVCLLRLDERTLPTSETARARFEAIQQFAAQGLAYLEDTKVETDKSTP